MFVGLGLLGAVAVAPSNTLLRGNALSNTCRPTYLEDYAYANFGEELQKPYWTIDDGVPILLGKDPAFAQVRDFAPDRYRNQIATEAMRLRSLVQKAQEVGDLEQRFRSWVLINWAIRQHIQVPRQLLRIALDRGLPIVGYPDRVEIIVEHYEGEAKLAEVEIARQSAQVAELKSLVGEHADELAALSLTIEKLQSDLKQAAENAAELSRIAESDNVRAQPQATGSDTRKYNTVCKLLYGLSKFAYGINLASAQKPNISKMMSDLLQVGVSIDDETLRKHLRKGSEEAAK